MRRHKMRKKKTVVGEVSEEDNNKGEKRDDFVPNNGETTMDVEAPAPIRNASAPMTKTRRNSPTAATTAIMTVTA